MFLREDDGDDTCGCTMGSSCAFHAEQGRREREAARADFIRRGINPDAEVTEDLAEIWGSVSLTPELTKRQKEAIQRILFPLGGAPEVTAAEAGWHHEVKSRFDKAMAEAQKRGFSVYQEPPKPKRGKAPKTKGKTGPSNAPLTYDEFIVDLFSKGRSTKRG